MTAWEYRHRGRSALRGRWGAAIGVCLLAALLMGGLVPVAGGGTSGVQANLQEAAQFGYLLRLTTTIALAMTLSAFILGGAVEIGKAGFFLRVAEGQPVKVRMLFDHFHRIGTGMALYWLRMLLLILWMMPGLALTVGMIVLTGETENLIFMYGGMALSLFLGFWASCRYALAPYLMAANQTLGAWAALRLSGERMKGYKWKYICLKLSFLGWTFLCLFTYGIGELFLQPYMAAAEAAFFQDRMTDH